MCWRAVDDEEGLFGRDKVLFCARLQFTESVSHGLPFSDASGTSIFGIPKEKINKLFEEYQQLDRLSSCDHSHRLPVDPYVARLQR